MVPDSLVNERWDIVGISTRFTSFMKSNAKLLCFAQDDPQLDPNRTEHLYGRSYAHPSMWDRYAEGHTGVCLLLDRHGLSSAVESAAAGRGPLHHGAVSYADMPSDENAAYTLDARDLSARGEQGAFADHQAKFHRALYFQKSSDWSSEFEYRWVLLDDDPGHAFVDIRRCLKAVIFGEAVDKTMVPFVRGELERRKIELGAMRYRNGHPMVLPWTF